MKKTFVILASIALFAACAKEQTPVLESVDGARTMYLTASIPDMTGLNQTKASVDNTSFSWAEGDVIGIPKAGGGYLPFVYDRDAEKFKYTLKDGEAVASGTAVYPGNSTTGVQDESYTFSSVTAAESGFKMTASYTLGASSLSFTHQSALISLSFANVPSFATSIEIASGASTVASVALSSPSATLNVKVPVPPSVSAATYTITLKQGSNVLKSVQEKGAKEDEVYKGITLSAGKYYTTPMIPVFTVAVKNDSDWENPQIYVWRTDNDTDKKYYLSLPSVTIGDDTYLYAALTESWATEGSSVGVAFLKNGSWGEGNSTQTDCVYLYRSFEFVCTGDKGSMKTDYRCYARFTSDGWSTWSGKGASGTDNVKFRWGYGSRPAIDTSNQPDCDEALIAGTGKVFYYTFESSYYGYSNVYWGVYNPNDTGWVSDWDNASINRDMLKDVL